MGATLGLVAGSGRFPFEVAEAARERGLRVAVAAIEHNTDPAIEALANGTFAWLAAGELGRLIEFLKAAGAGEVIFAGAIAKPEMLSDPAVLRPDARALALIARLELRGDDALLRAIAGELESEGLPVVESTRHLGDRLTAAGLLVGPVPDERVARDLARGLVLARGLGRVDVGQSVVVKEGTVVAVEAIEGTDETVRRGARYAGAGAVLVKTAKPGQDLRFDVPAIGRVTVDLAIECGLAAIGLEAGRTIVLEREAAMAAADAGGLSLVGLEDVA